MKNLIKILASGILKNGKISDEKLSAPYFLCDMLSENTDDARILLFKIISECMSSNEKDYIHQECSNALSFILAVKNQEGSSLIKNYRLVTDKLIRSWLPCDSNVTSQKSEVTVAEPVETKKDSRTFFKSM